MQTDGHSIDAERLDRLVEIDLALLDVEALLLQLLRNVSSGDGSEQLAFLTDAGREGERHLLQFRRDLLCRVPALAFRGLEARALLLDALQVSRRRFVREVVRKKVVPRIAILDLHDVAGLSKVLHGMTKNYVH